MGIGPELLCGGTDLDRGRNLTQSLCGVGTELTKSVSSAGIDRARSVCRARLQAPEHRVGMFRKTGGGVTCVRDALSERGTLALNFN